ncbi:MAG: phosphotransferase enzyme family protein [Ignavibacteriales bacterium]|nr:phosphotransferase enzyme family protein [Ignavibacteriales bacterium]MCF8305863.1 phosphotransferase enzyme family protein [Ignavibacteriales bacterium]MCF8315585.1 phosphotransferase enzyme family protein [Ignavibacteriales bacterium]MCF8436885.1 phosphotransferase enzyme family protein [Ignavibacteriales bacterium]
MIEKEKLLSDAFEKIIGNKPEKISKLPQSGSYREYYRLELAENSLIGAINSDKKENIAFIEFTRHFLKCGLPVPRIEYEDLQNNIYLLQDLGDITLFSHLQNVRSGDQFPPELVSIYKKILELLPKFQIEASVGLDYSKCYPRASFDKQSMMWDLNYFKYYFLKLAKIPFEEQSLEEDFQTFSDYLLTCGTEYFLYRDFQSRNIMLSEGEIFFIDYQGGRKGALQYDVASLIYDAKANIPVILREELLDHYISTLKKYIDVDEKPFRQYYYGYVLIRIMQAMGAYGFRGFYEKKEHFLKSIPYALENLEWLIRNTDIPLEIPALREVWTNLIRSDELAKFRDNAKDNELKVTITSFSYKDGVPEDFSGNGGGFVFDCRALHNPGRYLEFRDLNGHDAPVKEFLNRERAVAQFLNSVYNLVDGSVEIYLQRGFSDLMVNFGCTGGQHRSVYCAESLGAHLRKKFDVKVLVNHTRFPGKTK